MTSHISIDKNTNVAFIDVSEGVPDARIEVVSVSDLLGLRSQVLARVECESGDLLGLIIEDYPSFRREIMRKYVALRVGKIIDLIVSMVRESVLRHRNPRHRLAGAAL